jgi:hypothetical protein
MFSIWKKMLTHNLKSIQLIWSMKRGGPVRSDSVFDFGSSGESVGEIDGFRRR